MKGVKYKGRVLCWPNCLCLYYTGGSSDRAEVLNSSDEFESMPRCAWCGKLHDYVTIVKDGKKVVME